MKRFFTLLVCTCLLLSSLSMIGTLFAHATDSTTQTDTAADTQAGTNQDTSTNATTETKPTTPEWPSATLAHTDAPVSGGYLPYNFMPGEASGTFYFYMPKDFNATSYALYWGDADGKPLSGYSAFHQGEITSEYVMALFGENFSIPEKADCILVYTYSEAYGECPAPLKTTFHQVSTPSLGNKLSEFVIVSGLHLGKDKNSQKNFAGMLKDVKANAPDAAGIIVVGDSVDCASAENYALFDQLYASVKGIPPIFRGLGNQEYLAPGTYAYDKAAHSTNLQLFFEHESMPDGSKITTPYYSYTLGGVTMVFIGADEYLEGKAVYSKEQLTWLSETLRKAPANRPVLLFMHEPIPETVSGSTLEQSFGDVHNSPELKRIFERHENLFIFSGHTHWPMEATRTMHRLDGGARIFNTAGISHLWSDDGKGAGYETPGSQGYYVTVYEGGVLVRGRNFITGEWIGQAEYICAIKDPEPVTQAPATKAPEKATSSKETETTEEEEDSGLGDLIPPLTILALMVVIVFILVFRKPKNTQ